MGQSNEETEPVHFGSANKYVSAIYRYLQIIITDELADLKIGSGQFIFLLEVAESQGITQKELSNKLLVDKTTTAKAITKLETEVYVTRISSPEDQRCNQIFLTEKGERVVPEVRKRLFKLMKVGRTGFSDEEYELFLVLLKRMLHNVHAMVHHKEGEQL